MIGNLFDFLGYKFQDASKGSSPENRLLQSILPINAYNLIYQTYYQDQNVGVAKTIDDPVLLDEDMIVDLDFDSTSQSYEAASGEDIKNYFNLRRRCWKKDYFTSALPFTQRGADVHIPIYGNAPIVSDGYTLNTDSNGAYSFGGADIGSPQTPAFIGNASGYNLAANGQVSGHVHSYNTNDIAEHLSVDTSNVTAATINELRRAVQLQNILRFRLVSVAVIKNLYLVILVST